ncbi:MAG: acetolactate decarboxylase [Victivallales bacterium]
MKQLIKVILLGILLYSSSGCAHWSKDKKEAIYQVSTIDALLNSCYDGSVDIRTVRRHGDTGIGTFDQLDGEMIVLDGDCYKIKSDGKIVQADDSETTPFCAVAFFEDERSVELQPGSRLNQLSSSMLGSRNYFYAIKITGKFKMLKARSVPKQSKPYPMLIEIVKTQPVFNYEDIEGTAVGFFSPSFAKGLNVSGFHLHFISSDRKSGGHILDFEIAEAVMQVDETHGFTMILPDDESFRQLDLTKDREKELNKVEK